MIKSKKILSLMLILISSVALIGCKDKKTSNDIVSVIYYTNTGSNEIVANKIETNFDLHIGDKIPEPEEPVAFGAVFRGWYKDIRYTNKWIFDEDLVQGSTVLYAKWQIADFQITYDLSGGTLIDAAIDSYSALVVTLLPKASRVGSKFKGWILTPVDEYKVGDKIITSTKGYAKDLDLYALFDYVDYIIRFDTLNEMSNPKTTTILYNSLINLTQLSDTNDKKFVGWFTKNGTETGDWGVQLVNGTAYNIPNDLTLYAKWDDK